MHTREIKTGLFAKAAALGAAALTFGLLAAPPVAAGTCYGTLTTYFNTPAMLVCGGATVSCPGYPDQHDTGPDGQVVQTPYFTTETVVCPCPPGGGQTPPGDDDELPPEE